MKGITFFHAYTVNIKDFLTEEPFNVLLVFQILKSISWLSFLKLRQNLILIILTRLWKGQIIVTYMKSFQLLFAPYSPRTLVPTMLPQVAILLSEPSKSRDYRC